MSITTEIISEKLIEDVKNSIKERNSQFLMKLIDDMRPADVADLIEHLDREERLYLFELLEPEGAGEVLLEIEPQVQESIISDLDNKIITEIDGGEIVNMVGETANSFYGYVFKGVYTSEEDAINSGMVNNKDMEYHGGDAIYEDISGPLGRPDSVINEFDKTVIGSAMPDMFGALFNTFTYKRWSLSAMVQFVSGNDVYNYVRFQNEKMTDLVNQSRNTLGRWQYDGQETDVPRALWNDPVGNSDFSTRWIEDGSFLRLKSITLRYRIPDEFLVFRNAEVYFTAFNLFSRSSYLGYDPEFAYSYSNVNQGIDYGLMPQARQFVGGFKIGL